MTQQQNQARQLIGESWIRKVLMVNGVSSGGTALLLLLFPGFVGKLTGLDNQAALMGAGAYLLLVVAFTFIIASRKTVSPKAVLTLSVIDFLWLFKSIILLGLSSSFLTAIGTAAVIFVALVVGVFAVFEAVYYNHNRSYDNAR
ncbi:hypothetical protein NQ117_12310 [Paenibacillus sp. SC116]|uniref:hypothetical protein n=1 Tax=Paenibacillus sp. SC116 TaxID=2968986 RepID=UPI00215AD52C|nr:hypothetical protein [Paenibacillus sp. SC116]MCR8844469.1 hypothetical protein [Paenibacillus sp. SC116]